MVSWTGPLPSWLKFLLISCFWLLAAGQQTYYCSQDETLDVDVTTGTATIITRLPGDSNYANNLNCKWEITASANGDTKKRIHVKVVSTDLDYAPDGSNCNSYDFVAVKEDYMDDDEEAYYDWNEAELGHYFSWCGASNPGYFSSIDDTLVVEFQTNDRNTYDKTGVVLEVSSFEVGSCPPEWVEETSRSTNYCYRLRSNEGTWADAQDYCNKEQANLVSFADNTERDFVTDLIQSSEGLKRNDMVWIGLNDIKENGDYVWIDGISSSVSYRWKSSPHEANVYDNCVAVRYSDGRWQEEFCTDAEVQTTEKHSFVCKTNKEGPWTLHLIPEDREEREGEGTDLPVHYIIVACVIGVIILASATALLVYVCKKKRANDAASKRRSYTSTPTRESGTGVQNVPSVQPPSYNEAIRS